MIKLIALVLAGATTLAAQGPVGPGPMRRPDAGAPAARLLLSHTGELELTDAQVVKLAAIERRAEARRKTLRAAMDSARKRFAGNPADSVARRQFAQRMQTDMERAGEQARVDQRDAIATLTADQQAKAWGLVANRGRAMRQGMQGGMGGGGGMRRGMRGGDRGGMRPGMPGMRPPRPMDGQPGNDGRRPMRQPRAPRPPLDQ